MKLLALSFFLLSASLIAKGFEHVQIKPQKVRGNIYMLKGAGGNIGLSVGEDGVFIIDDQFSPLHKKIKKAIAQYSKGPVRFIINTHWHGDHTGGNELFGKQGSIIVAHENVRKRMSKENFNTIFKRKTPPSPNSALPVVTFPDQMKIHLNGEEARLIHHPHAHTDGDSIIYFPKSNVLHAGDIYFNGFYPFIDLDSGGSFTGLIKAVKKVISLTNSKSLIIPGHGKLAAQKDFKNYYRLLIKIKSLILPHVKSGESVKEIIALDPLKSLHKKYGQGFMKPKVFTRIITRSLQKEKH